MRIVHVNFSLETGGIETMLVDILNEQCSQADVHFILINEQFNASLLARISPNVTIWRIGRAAKSRNPLHVAKLNWLLYRLNPAVVHCHNHQIARLLRGFADRRCLTLHTTQVPAVFFDRYNKLFAISETVRQDVRQRANADARLVYNGVHTDQIRYRTAYTRDKSFRLVQISRLQHQVKGQHILLRALHQLVHENGMEHLRADFVGEGDSRPYLEQLTHDLQLTNCVRFLGLKTRAELYNDLHQYDLLVQPSLHEGFGLTIAEGMAAGVPVVVSDIDGPMEVIDQGTYGYPFRTGDADALAEVIRRVVLGYESGAVQLKATRARQHVRTVFDIGQTARHYLANY